MKLNIYEHKEIIKTYEVDAYDLPFGIVEDLTDVLKIDEGLDDLDDGKILSLAGKLIMNSRDTIHTLLKDMFPGITDEEIRKTTVKDIARVLVDCVIYTMVSIEESFGWSAEKNAQRAGGKS